MKMRLDWILLIGLLSGCVPFNHVTSPEILGKNEREFNVGMVVEPQKFSLDTSLYAVQPLLGFRTGLGADGEFGLLVYGLTYPCLVLDYKHGLKEWHRAKLSGDMTFYGGYKRPTGLQYDLLFGSKKLYAQTGINYFFDHQLRPSSNPNWVLGVGHQTEGEMAVTFQLSASGSMGLNSKPEPYIGLPYYNSPYLSFGIKLNFIRNKGNRSLF